MSENELIFIGWYVWLLKYPETWDIDSARLYWRRRVSMPERFCSGRPEQKCSTDASKKAPISGPSCLSRFIPEGQRPTAALIGLGVTGAWSERA